MMIGPYTTEMPVAPERECVRDATATAVAGLVVAAALAALLDVVYATSPAAIGAGVALGVLPSAAAAVAMLRRRPRTSTRADRVTLTRAVLASGCAAVAAIALVGDVPVRSWWFLALALTTLLLDAADGAVARRTGTATSAGARLDMELDAGFLVVLSVAVSTLLGPWVLLVGAMRYLYLAASYARPVLRTPLPRSQFRRIVAGAQGLALVAALAPAVPLGLAGPGVLLALLLLLVSFGHQAVAVARQARSAGTLESPVRTPVEVEAPDPAGGRGRTRTLAAGVTTLLACVPVWFALVAPNQISRVTPGAFVRIPLEGLVMVAVALVLPAGPRRLVAALAGVVLGLLTLVKVVDMGVYATLDRPVNPVTDWAYAGPALGVLSDSIGRAGAILTVVVAVALVLALLVLMTLSVTRLTRLVARHRTGSIHTVLVLGVVWILCAGFGIRFVGDTPIASSSAAGLAYEQVRELRTGIRDREEFADAAAVDAFRDTPGADLLTGLRGKDVVVAFVESYGRVAVEDPAISPQVDAVLDAGTRRLKAAGFSSQSAFLTSPTFGGISWLAHSTLQSGLWVDNQQRYDDLVASDRLTLSGAFRRAGWRTVADVPSNQRDWPEGTSFYRYDQVYDARNVGYDGPTFSYATMPDQFTLSAFHRLELAKAERPPVMAEIDLVSSHAPWAPLPRLVDWNEVGDGSVFDRMPAQGESPDEVWRDADRVRAAYGQSIVYSLDTLVSFVETYGDDDLVLLVLGDHQPATIVSGEDASHDVPVTIMARDPAVLDRISGWGWEDGMRPGPQAPVWPMDAFRDRFLAAYGRP